MGDHSPDVGNMVDDLSRELTEEIEAHRVTRAEAETRVKEWKARAEAAEARVRELEAEVHRLGELDTSYPHHLLVTARDDARDSKAALIRELGEYVNMYATRRDTFDGIAAILAKHEGER